ncbi:Serine carboxypeptidase-like, partial [Thalictrum thalictroides]
IEAGKEPLCNFKGYLIGNPVTDKHLELNTQVQFARAMGLISYELYTSLQRTCKGEYVNIDSSNTVCSKDYKTFSKWKSGVNTNQVLEPVCFDFLAKEDVSSDNKHSLDNEKPVLRLPSYEFSAKENVSVINKLLLNVRKSILRSYNCRQRKYQISENWANDHRVQTALNVRKGTVRKWIRCNFHGIPDNPDYGVPYDYNVNSSIAYQKNISTKGYRSLIYSGDHDMEVPHISTETWIRLLGSSIVDDWHWWIVDDQVAGYTRTYSNGMTYATVKGGVYQLKGYQCDVCKLNKRGSVVPQAPIPSI